MYIKLYFLIVIFVLLAGQVRASEPIDNPSYCPPYITMGNLWDYLKHGHSVPWKGQNFEMVTVVGQSQCHGTKSLQALNFPPSPKYTQHYKAFCAYRLICNENGAVEEMRIGVPR
jgi:hypothetical protein